MGDGATDASTWFPDADNDGYGDSAAGPTPACSQPEGRVADASDCDDATPAVSPAADERCDDRDNDCDGSVDWGHRVPTDFADIQAAIDGVSSGETVCVEAGTYTETIDFHGQDGTVQGIDCFGLMEIDADRVTVTGYGGEPAPAELTLAEALGEEYESVLVTVTDGTLDDSACDCSADGSGCTDADLWTLSDGTDALILYDLLYEDADRTTHMGASPATGVLGYRWERVRLMPRDASDLE